MNFTAFDSSLWCLDFALGAVGLLIIGQRHRNVWPLWMFLAWRSFGDALEFAALHNAHMYVRAYYVVSAVGLLLEILLAVVLCGELVREHRGWTWILASQIAAIWAGAFLVLHHGPLNVPAIIQSEAVSVGILGLLLIVGWIGKLEIAHVELPEPYRGVLAGTIALIFVQSVSFGLLARFGGAHWSIISRVQPCGEIIVLGIWCWSAWRPVRLGEYRRSLERRVV